MNRAAALLQLPGTVVIDVRMPDEFKTGHVTNSINIPLTELTAHLDELKAMQNIIVCCASGVRSLRANQLLRQHNIASCDGGAWISINGLLTN